LAILILAIALLDIFIRIIEKRFYKYLYVFTFLIFMRFINIAFAPELPVHRALLFIQSIIEVFTLFFLLADLKNIKNSDKIFFIRFIQSLVIIHLIASLVGFTANLTGHVNLAKILIDAIITNSLVALMLVISAVTIISLIQISIESSLSDKLNFIKNRRAYLKRMTEKIIVAVAVLIWVDSIIRILGLEKNAYDLLAKLFSDEISIGFATFTLGSILLFLFVIWLSIITGKVIRAVLDDDILTKVSLKKGVPRIISVMVQFTLVSLGVLLAVSSVGMPLDQLTIIFSAFSVGLGFGLQNIVNNFVSGVILLFERPIQIGDTVEIGNLIGNVKSMGIRSSNVRTFEGAEVIVPNGHLISNEVVNWTLSDKRRRIEIISGVAYGSEVHKVQKLLLSILKEHPDIINDPEPMVLFNDLGESSLDFRLLFWTDNFDEWIRIKSEVTFMIHDSLYKEGITIPFPQRDLHIKGDLGKLIFNNEKKEKE
jgi:small-conductance mechanosensitive channel